MRAVMVRYRVKPEMAAENERLVRAVYAELQAVKPAGLSYQTHKLADGVSFVHVAMYGTGGPLYTMFLARRLADKTRLRATIGVLVLGTAATRGLLLAGGGFYAQPGLLAATLALLPCALAGFAFGSLLHRRLPVARAMQAVWLLLVVAGSGLVWRSLTQLQG